MDSSSQANTSVEDLYGDIDDMYTSQSDGETLQTTDATVLSTSQSAMETVSQEETKNDSSVNDLDLYDDLIVEEGQQRIETLQEILKKYEEAMSLKTQLESENQALRKLVNKKECDTKDMQKNFSSLLITAKGEINRKDKELNNLRKRLSDSPGSYSRNRGIRNAKDRYNNTSTESDFDPPFASSPSRQRMARFTESAPKDDGRNTDHISRDVKEKNRHLSNKKHERNKSLSTDRNKDRTIRTGEACRISDRNKDEIKGSTEGRKGTEKNEHRTKSSERNEVLKSSKTRSPSKIQKIDKVIVSLEKKSRNLARRKETLKGLTPEKNCEKVKDVRKHDGQKEIEITDARYLLVSEERTFESTESNSTFDNGKEGKKIDLREKLRLKRLGVNSSDTTSTDKDKNKTESLKLSIDNLSDLEPNESVTVAKLKQTEDLSSSIESDSFSLFQSKGNKIQRKLEGKGKQNSAADKEFLEKLKISIKKSENKTTYNIESMSADRRHNRTEKVTARDDSVREIRSYTDVTHDLADTETELDGTFTSECYSSTDNYFSVSEVPIIESLPKSRERNSKNDEQSEPDNNVENKRKDYLNNNVSMKVDTDLTYKNVEFKPKNQVQNKQDFNKALYNESSTASEAEEEIPSKSGTGMNTNIIKSCEKEVSLNQSSKNPFQHVDTGSNHTSSVPVEETSKDVEINESTEEAESSGLLRRSARLLSKSDPSINSIGDSENNTLTKTNTNRKSTDMATVDGNNYDKAHDEIVFSENIISGNIQNGSSKKKKKRIHRSVTSETISSVTTVDTSESLTDICSGVSEDTEESSLSAENISTSDDVSSSEKSVKLEKWVCQNKNCAIKMRHLHPKCSEANIDKRDLQKGNKELLTLDSEACSQELMNKKVEGCQANKPEEMEVDNVETGFSENISQNGCLNTMMQCTELVNEDRKHVTSGTIELAEKGSVGSSEYFREGSISSSYSSASDSSSGSDSEFSEDDMKLPVDEVNKATDKECTKLQVDKADSTSINEYGDNASSVLVGKRQKKNENYMLQGDPKKHYSFDTPEPALTLQNRVSIIELPHQVVNQKSVETKPNMKLKRQSEANQNEVNQFEKTNQESMDVDDNQSRTENDASTKTGTETEASISEVPRHTDIGSKITENSFQMTLGKEANVIEYNTTDDARAEKDKENIEVPDFAGKETNAVGDIVDKDDEKIVQNKKSEDETDSDLSDSDNSEDSTYTGQSSYSSSDESGTSSSWETDSSESESDSGDEIQDIRDKNIRVVDNSVKPNSKSTDALCSEQVGQEEIKGDGSDVSRKIADIGLNHLTYCEKGNMYTETACESQQNGKEMHLSDNAEKGKSGNFELDNSAHKIPAVQNDPKSTSDTPISNGVVLNEKTASDESASALLENKKYNARRRSSNNVPSSRSNLLQNLLKCVQNEFKSKESSEAVSSMQDKKSKVCEETNKVKDRGFESTDASGNSSEHQMKPSECSENTVEDIHLFCNDSSLSSNILTADVGETTTVNDIRKGETMVKFYEVDGEKSKCTEKDDETFLETPRISVGAILNENKSNDICGKPNKNARSTDIEDGKLQNKSDKVIDEKKSDGSFASSDSSDCEYSFSSSSSHSSDCSTCSSGSGSSTETDSETDSYESGEESNQMEQNNIDTNVSNEKSTKFQKEIEKPVNKCETSEMPMSVSSFITGNYQENEKEFVNSNGDIVGQINSPNSNQANSKPCEKNPYWIADVELSFLSDADNSCNSDKKSTPSDTGKDLKTLTPAVKFVDLNVSPTNKIVTSPGNTVSSSSNDKHETPQTPSRARSVLGVISPVIGVGKIQGKITNSLENEESKNRDGLKTELSSNSKKNGSGTLDKSVNKLKAGEKLSLSDSREKKSSNLSKVFPTLEKETNVSSSASVEMNTKRVKNIGKGESCKPINQAGLKTIRNTQSKIVSNSSKEKSKNIQPETKAKKAEDTPLRRSPRKKPSQTYLTDPKPERRSFEKVEKSATKKDKVSKTPISKAKMCRSEMNMHSVTRSNYLKSTEEPMCSNKPTGVDRTKERNAKKVCSDISIISKEKKLHATRKTYENNKGKSNGKENLKTGSKAENEAPKKASDCKLIEKSKNSSVSTSSKINAGNVGSKTEVSSAGKRGVIAKSFKDTTKVLTEKIMKLKVEKNLLEKELAEKQGDRTSPKLKNAPAKLSELKSSIGVKENLKKSKDTVTNVNRSGRIQPLTLALAANGRTEPNNRSRKTGCLDKNENLTFDEKLADSERLINKSKSRDKVSEKLRPTTGALLKTFTIPKINAGKKSSKGNSNERNSKRKDEALTHRKTNSTGSEKMERNVEHRNSKLGETKKNSVKMDTNKKTAHQTNAVKKRFTSSESESGEESDSSDVDNDALVKAVFGSSDSSGNSGKSLTLDDLCKTRSSEDTDDIVKDCSSDLRTHSNGSRDVKVSYKLDNTNKVLAIAKTTAAYCKVSNCEKPNISCNRSQETGLAKQSCQSKCSNIEITDTNIGVKCCQVVVSRKEFRKEIQGNCTCDKTDVKSVINDQLRRKSPRIKGHMSHEKSSSNTGDQTVSNGKVICHKELRSSGSPQKSEEGKISSEKEVRYFEISNKNPFLNKIVSPKKPTYDAQTVSNEKSLIKGKINHAAETTTSKNHKQTKGVPILLLEENTMDGIDYHDDLTYDIDSANPEIETGAEDTEGSENEINESKIVANEHSESDQSVEDGEISSSDDETGLEKPEGTNQMYNEMTPKKLKPVSNKKDKFSPIHFPVSPSRSNCDRETCNCVMTGCIHKRIGVSDRKRRKIYRSDSNSCSEPTDGRSKHRLRPDQLFIRERSRSGERTDSPGYRRREKSERFMDSGKRSVSPRRRNRRSRSNSLQRYQRHSKSRSISPRRRRRKRSRSHSPARSRLTGRDYRTDRLRHRYRDDGDERSQRQHRRNRSSSSELSPKAKGSHRGNKYRYHKESSFEASVNKSNRSNKQPVLRRNNEDLSGVSDGDQVKEKLNANVSIVTESSDEENERFCKLKSEKRCQPHTEKTTFEKSESRKEAFRRRNRYSFRDSSDFSPEKTRPTRTRSRSLKRKRCVSESVSETESDSEKRISHANSDSNQSKARRCKRSRTEKNITENVSEKSKRR